MKRHLKIGLIYTLLSAGIFFLFNSCDSGQDPIDNPDGIELVTTAITEITKNSAQSGGTITYTGLETIISRGVCYGTTSLPDIYHSTVFSGQGPGEFISTINALQASTHYYVRAYAIIGDTAYYGNELEFETLENDYHYGSLTDIEGNEYRTTEYGTQTWMADNLRTEKYNDGTEIELVEDSMTWYQLTSPAYCYYHNQETTYKETMGALYNFYAVATDKLCPSGWHVPSATEWQTLLAYLSANGFNYDGTTVSNKVAVAMCTWEGWGYSTGMGCPGNDDYQFLHNASGFSARPAGFRFPLSPTIFGSYLYLGTQATWWADEFNETMANSAVIDNLSPLVNVTGQFKVAGKSVRCVKD